MNFPILSWALVVLAVAVPLQPNPPDWPSSVYVFDPIAAEAGGTSQAQKTIQEAFNMNGGPMEHGQFSSHRFALLFKPGRYDIEVPVGYYTQVLGLGSKPSDVVFTSSKGVFCEEANTRPQPGALDTFWRGAENFQTDASFVWLPGKPQKGMMWAASQASTLRRLAVTNDVFLFEYVPPFPNAGMASGGFMGNTDVKGTVVSGSQQQYLARNSRVKKWENGVWNLVFVGVDGAPPSHCGADLANPDLVHPYVTVPSAPAIAEKPFISILESGHYQLNIPRVMHDRSGPDFDNMDTVGFESVHVAKAETDTAATINAKLKDGLHVVFAPGIYELAESLQVNTKGQVLLGLGLATLVATEGTPCITVGNVDGVRVAGLLLEAGSKMSETLIDWGSFNDRYAGNPSDPGVISDLFARVGGPTRPSPAQTQIMFRVNSGNVILDNAWLWRADHVQGGGLVYDGDNPCEVGAVINGDNVVAYGFKVEHALTDQVQWNGDKGKTYMFQCELPYDVTQANFGDQHYTGYRVANQVKEHLAYGVGVYHFFRDHPVTVDSGIVVPPALVNSFISPLAVRLNGLGTFRHILNGFGPETTVDPTKPNDAVVKWLCETLPTPPPTPAPPAPLAPPPAPIPPQQCDTNTGYHCTFRNCAQRGVYNSKCFTGWHGIYRFAHCICEPGFCFMSTGQYAGSCWKPGDPSAMALIGDTPNGVWNVANSSAHVGTLAFTGDSARKHVNQVAPVPRTFLSSSSLAWAAPAIAASAGMYFHMRRSAPLLGREPLLA